MKIRTGKKFLPGAKFLPGLSEKKKKFIPTAMENNQL
jgi:hypothetical protein